MAVEMCALPRESLSSACQPVFQVCTAPTSALLDSCSWNMDLTHILVH